MTEVTMNFITGDGERFPNSRSTREALAKWAKAEFASRKELARALDLTEDQARSVMAGEASAVVVDHIWRHPHGGPRVAFAVIRAVTGSAFDQFVKNELREIADAQRRLEEVNQKSRARWARVLGSDPLADDAADPAPDRGRRMADLEPRRGGRDRRNLDRSSRARPPLND
jgi:hypothetical protein